MVTRPERLAPSLDSTEAMNHQETSVAHVERAIKSNKDQKTALLAYIQNLEAQLGAVDALIVGKTRSQEQSNLSSYRRTGWCRSSHGRSR